YIIPPRSSFLLSDFSEIDLLAKVETKFDFVVVDPPWQNKSVKRKKRYYETFSMLNLVKIPMPEWCNENCLVAVWVTNKIKYQDYVREELFPSWNLQFVATWYWLKVTKKLTPVYPLLLSTSSTKHPKKPYELLMLGRFRLEKYHLMSNSNIDCKIQDRMVIISVPSAIHSHKPYLREVFKDHLPEDAKCLELFARNLQSGWTSWGNEVRVCVWIYQQYIFISLSLLGMQSTLACSQDLINII
ncbi:hypothetical protein HELRODRAFT_69400, partial [Helobdella robusta]|uniref:Methyltransferase-like protein 4 n=1 Tax=Helobdella robusta TaxID=6412 RepID=T1FZU7_HELRO